MGCDHLSKIPKNVGSTWINDDQPECFGLDLRAVFIHMFLRTHVFPCFPPSVIPVLLVGQQGPTSRFNFKGAGMVFAKNHKCCLLSV